jgi:hypothetical protein
VETDFRLTRSIQIDRAHFLSALFFVLLFRWVDRKDRNNKKAPPRKKTKAKETGKLLREDRNNKKAPPRRKTKAKETGRLIARHELKEVRKAHYESRETEKTVRIPNAMGVPMLREYMSYREEESKRELCYQVLRQVLDNGGIFREKQQDSSIENWIVVPYEVAFKKVQQFFMTKMCKVKKDGMSDSGQVEYPDFSRPAERSQVSSTTRATEIGSVAERLEMIAIATLGNLPEAKHTYKVETEKFKDPNWAVVSVVSELPEIVWTYFLFAVIVQIILLDGYILIKIWYVMFPGGAPYFKSPRFLNPFSMDG